MCILVVPAKVEAGGGREVPGLFAMEYHLHVDQAPGLHVEGDSGPRELGDQDREIEAPDVEPRQVAGLEQLGEGLGGGLKGGLVRDVLVGDPVNGRSLRRNRHLGVVAAHALEDIAARRHPDHGEFNDPVPGKAQAGRLQVEEDDRAVKVEGQFHGGYSAIADARRATPPVE